MSKTDNSNVNAKLLLRRHFLRKYHMDEPPSVFDCCQGGGVMWSVLRKQFTVKSYWGVDLKPKPGRLKIDSVDVLANTGWRFDVIDVDTYGSPWRHFDQILRNGTTDCTVFLTIGNQNTSAMSPNAHGGEFVNFPPRTPPSLRAKVLRRFSVSWLLARSCEFGKMVVEAVESVSDGGARYVAARLEVKRAAAVDAATALDSPANKEQGNGR